MNICFLRESRDKQSAAWYIESCYYGHHYRYFSYSPWHTSGSGTRFDKEVDARRAVDHFMDEWLPLVLRERQER